MTTPSPFPWESSRVTVPTFRSSSPSTTKSCATVPPFVMVREAEAGTTEEQAFRGAAAVTV
ncbi:MAG: hypothetical protein EDX89_01805 [Acidobacteria bacterium]|nr:MAG: hypothetical protein EDX89_01805 [Acidobacteriota bacterium]